MCRARPRPPRPSGRWVVLSAAAVAARDRPTPAARQRRRRSADRGPRAGVAGARGRDDLPRRRVRSPGRGRRRPRRQHQPDRLPGGLHRPLVRGPGRRDDLPADRQLRPAASTTTSRSGHGSGRSSSRMRPPRSLEDARQLASLLRDAGIPAIAGVDTRALARHLRANGCLRGHRHGARERGPRRARSRPRGRVPRWEDQDFVGAGVAARDHGVRRGGRWRTADRDRRSRAQVEHRPSDAPPRRAGPGLPAHGRRAADVLSSDIDGVILSPGPGDPARLDGPGRAGPRDHRRRSAAARDLPGAPDRGARRRGRHTPAAVRPPRRESPGPRRRPRPGPGHGPEPRGPGRRDVAAERIGLPGEPGQPQRRFGRRAAPSRRCRSRRSSTTPRARPGPSTRWPCSIGSSRRRVRRGPGD